MVKLLMLSAHYSCWNTGWPCNHCCRKKTQSTLAACSENNVKGSIIMFVITHRTQRTCRERPSYPNTVGFKVGSMTQTKIGGYSHQGSKQKSGSSDWGPPQCVRFICWGGPEIRETERGRHRGERRLWGRCQGPKIAENATLLVFLPLWLIRSAVINKRRFATIVAETTQRMVVTGPKTNAP